MQNTMTKQPMDNSNWKEDYKGYKHLNKKQRDLLEDGLEVYLNLGCSVRCIRNGKE